MGDEKPVEILVEPSEAKRETFGERTWTAQALSVMLFAGILTRTVTCS
jgi:hypothetical protein